MHRELKAKQSETSSQLVENKRETRGESPAERSVVDPELMKTERRKKAALFLDQMRKDRVVGTVVLPCELLQRLQRDVFFISQGKESIDETESAEIGSTSSSAKKSKSGSPDDVDVEIIAAISGETRERSRRSANIPNSIMCLLFYVNYFDGILSLSTCRSISRSPSEIRRVRRRSRTRSPQSSRARYRSVSRTRRSRSRSRSRNRPIHRSPSPRRQHKKHRSRDR